MSTGTDNERHLRIYAPGDDTWVPRLDMPLRPEVLFVDIANIVSPISISFSRTNT